MRNNQPPSPSSGKPVHLRLDLLLHEKNGDSRPEERSGRLPARPSKPLTPAELLSESALNRDRLANLLKGTAPAAVDPESAPDIEVTLVLYV